jgi:hypothetical protein
MKCLLLNQTFYPDVMATGQYLTEVAVRLVERGHQVTVVTSRRAYDQPRTQFPKTETWRGIRVYRVGSTGGAVGTAGLQNHGTTRRRAHGITRLITRRLSRCDLGL